MSKIALYMRLSVEERSVGESTSIRSQRELLHDYLDANDELKKIPREEYVDDGYSGSTEKRPSLQRLLKDMKQGVIKTIIVKDMSRFMRDYIRMGDYLENIFPFMQVRFISISENYDSNKEKGNGTELDIQFKNLLYDFYVKDSSAKIKSVCDAMRKQGKYLAGHVPFGYIRDPEDRHKIIPDEVGAPIVQRIYQLYLDGHSVRDIAKILKGTKTISPRIRKHQLTGYDYSHFVLHPDDLYDWSKSTIIRILGNETYIGTYVYNTKYNSPNGKQKNRPESEWKKIENNHPAIISRETFERVQYEKKHVRHNFNNVDHSKKSGDRFPVQTVARCKNCNHKLTITKMERSYGTYYYLYCECMKEMAGKTPFINVNTVQDFVRKVLENVVPNQPKEMKPQRDIAKEIEKLKKEKDRYFEQYKLGKLSRENLVKRKATIEASIKELETIQTDKEEKPNVKMEDKLTHEMVNRYVDTVYIDHYGNIEVVLKN